MKINGKISLFHNHKAIAKTQYTFKQKQVFNIADVAKTKSDIKLFPNYKKTPLFSLSDLADDTQVDTLWYKDESQRFGLKSFKALGGAYAVALQLQKIISAQMGHHITIAELLSAKYNNLVKQVSITCATDGNHGRSVAWGCQIFGCACFIYIHKDVSVGREEAMKSLGAIVIRIDGNYDESVRTADKDAKKYNRIVVSDTSYSGYTTIPKSVGLGYGVMLDEIVEALKDEIPTHVFVQAGVGGFAAIVCGFFWQFWKENRPRFIIVEPEQANCLQKSAINNQMTTIHGDLATMMAGLACGEVSLIAWEILQNGVDDFLTVSEDVIPQIMRLLAKGHGKDPKIEAGESAVAGLGAFVIIAQNKELRIKLKIDNNSKILFFGTEGATDPELYNELVADTTITPKT